MIVTAPEWQERMGRWLADRLDSEYCPGKMACIGEVRNEGFIAVSGFENYLGRSMMIHIAIEGWVGKVFPRAVFGYAFDCVGVHKLIGPVDSANVKALKLNAHLGFVEEARIRDAGRYGDMIMLTMTREQCRVLNRKLRSPQ